MFLVVCLCRYIFLVVWMRVSVCIGECLWLCVSVCVGECFCLCGWCECQLGEWFWLCGWCFMSVWVNVVWVSRWCVCRHKMNMFCVRWGASVRGVS